MSSWLSDSTANRYIKTYFKDWIDVNGDITCRNNLIFQDGTIQNTASTANTWIDKNIVNSPPAIVFNTSYPSTSSMIYVSWTYPTQLEIGMLNLYLPVISAFNATLTAQINGTVSTSNLITNDTSTNTIRYNGQTETTNYITGIVLTNINVNTGYQYLQFPNEAFSRHCYVAYSSSFANLQDNTNNCITAWYTNFQSTTSPSSTHFNIFLQAGAPSAPGIPTFGSQTANNSGITVSATTTAPAYTDNINHTNTASMQNYRMNKSSSGSSIRYYGAIADSATWVYGVGNSLSISLTNLYPDSTYSVYAQGQNNSTNTNYGDSSSTATLNTTYLTAPNSYGSISFSPTSYTCKLVSNDSSVSNVILSNPAPITSNSIIAPIHYVNTRASNATGLLKFNIDITRGGTAIETGSNVKYDGYPISTPSAFSSANIAINTNAPTDYYNSSTSNPLAGYYLTCSNTVTLKSPVFTASNSQTVVTLIQTQYQTNGTTANNTQTSNYTFYYDVYSSTPSITSITIGLRSLSTYVISGVYVASGDIGINATSIVNNIGTYFYNSNQIIDYTNSTGQKETNLSNIGTHSSSLSNTITFTNNSSVYQNYSNFSLGAQLNETVYSPTGSSSSGSSNTLNIVLDDPSYKLITSSNYPSVNGSYVGIGYSSTTGWRIGSGTATTIGSSSYVSALPPTASYASTAYNNSQLLTTNQDLQLFNGKYRSKGSSTQGYINYSSYYQTTSTFNTANYSTISATGYRYCTFAWKVNTNASNYTKVQFQLLGNISNNVNNPDSLPNVGSTRLYLYYRIEDSANYSTFSASYRNTTWIDINNNVNGITSGNYYNNSIIVDGKNTASGYNNSFTGGVYTVNGLTQSFSVGASDNVYLYFRVCVPMNEDFDFDSVRCTLI